MVHIICCFQCPSAVVEEWQKSPVFHCTVGFLCFFLISRGIFFYTSIYYFLVASGNKSFFSKCPCGWLLFWSSSPEKTLLAVGKNTKTVFSRVVLSMWTNGSRMGFQCIEKREGRGLEMTARKKQQRHVHISFIFLQEADGTNFDAKLLIRCTNIHRSNVNDGQAGCFRGLVIDDCLAPCASV